MLRVMAEIESAIAIISAYSYVLYYTVDVIIKYVLYVVTAKTMATTCIYQMPNMETEAKSVEAAGVWFH